MQYSNYFKQNNIILIITNIYYEHRWFIKISKKKFSKFINVEYSQNNFFNQLSNIVVVFNMFFRAIKNFAFRNLIQMLKSNVKFFEQIKFVEFIRKKHDVVKHTLFQNLKFDTKINITLNN